MIVAGFGFRKGVRVESLWDALDKATSGVDVDLIATAADKAEEEGMQMMAADMGVGLARVDADAMTAQSTVTKSAASLDARGTGSVAEAAALAAAGRDAHLIRPRVVSTDGTATCALAEGNGGAS